MYIHAGKTHVRAIKWTNNFKCNKNFKRKTGSGLGRHSISKVHANCPEIPQGSACLCLPSASITSHHQPVWIFHLCSGDQTQVLTFTGKAPYWLSYPSQWLDLTYLIIYSLTYILIYLLCIVVLIECIFVYHMDAWCPWKTEECVRLLGTFWSNFFFKNS